MNNGSSFETEIHVDTGSQTIAAYGLIIDYDPEILPVDTVSGQDGISYGDGGFVAAVNSDTPGALTVSGFDVDGKGPSPEQYLFTINRRAVGTGISAIDLTINDLADNTFLILGTPTDLDGSVTVK